jgi:hypothetical protein
MRLKLFGAIVLLALAGCGSAGQPGATSSPSPSPSASSKKLFAIATGLPGFQLVNTYPLQDHVTVKIVDATGHVYAQANFVPPPPQAIQDAVPLVQSSVRTAAGAVFYADNTGAVHRLNVDGTTSVVATFPLSNAQQGLSYAVSPDGAHLIAIVLTTPLLHDPPPQSLSDPLFQTGGHWSLKLETADAGGSTTTTFQRDLGTAYPSPTQIVGWDKNGPLATISTSLGVQQAPPSAHFFGSLIHIAADGTHLDAVGGPNCTPVDALSDGTVVCDQDWHQFSVHTSSGATLWQSSFPADNYYFGVWLSPDANSVAAQGIVVTRTSVASSARPNNGGQSQQIVLGWLDSSTVIVASPSGELSLYEAHGFTKIRDLGLNGIFEGTL